jgi:hypothetical protein
MDGREACSTSTSSSLWLPNFFKATVKPSGVKVPKDRKMSLKFLVSLKSSLKSIVR